MKNIFTTLIFICLTSLAICSFGQNMYFTTFSFDAPIEAVSTPHSEVSATLDKQKRVHIAWIKNESDVTTLMYSRYDNNNSIYTVTAVTSSGPEKFYSVSIVTDQNDKPHITWFKKRDKNASCCKSGNYAVMYAGDPEGDGSFVSSQVSSNSTDLNDDSDNIFHCYVNGRPNISLTPGNEILVSYYSDESSLTAYDSWIIFAVKNGSSWSLTQEFDLDSYGVTAASVDNDISLPERMTSESHCAWSDITDYKPRFNVKSGVWQNVIIPGCIGYTNLDHVQIAVDDNNVIHYFWICDSDKKFSHTTLSGANYSTVEETSFVNVPGSNFGPATVDMVTGKKVYCYQRYSNSKFYFITFDNSNVSTETEATLAGTFYGKKSLFARNGYVCLVTASLTNDKIYISVNNGSAGVENLNNENSITVFPNPADKVLQIGTDAAIKKLQITDNFGKTVLVFNAPKGNQVDVSRLQPGMYIVEIQTAQEVSRSRIVIY